MTRGFVDSGRFTPVFAVEIDSDAAVTYAANFGADHIFVGPIEKVAEFPGADVLIGGPPCQGFSPLNRDGVGAERRALWREYVRAIEEAMPAAFVMENVPELLTSPEYASFRDAAAQRGFCIRGEVLNAADFGVPQRRRRATSDPASARPVARADPFQPRCAGDRDAALAYVRRRRRRSSSGPRRAELAQPSQPPARKHHPLQGGPTRRRRPIPDATQPRRGGSGPSGSCMLAEQALRHHRRVRPAAVETPCVHDPNGVLQAREGPLSPSVCASPDHRPRGRPMHVFRG